MDGCKCPTTDRIARRMGFSELETGAILEIRRVFHFSLAKYLTPLRRWQIHKHWLERYHTLYTLTKQTEEASLITLTSSEIGF